MATSGDLRRLGMDPTQDGGFRIVDGAFHVGGRLTKKVTPLTSAEAGALTLTAAQILDGLILRDPAGANRSDVTPTAALLVAAIQEPAVGDSFEFTIRNTANGDETIILTAGTGFTLSGVMRIERAQSRKFLVRITNALVGSEAVILYDLGLLNNRYYLQVELTDISTASAAYIVAPVAGSIRKVTSILHSVITSADAVLTIASSVGNVVETITVANSGSAAGDIDTITPAQHANVIVAEGTLISVTTSGASSTAARVTVVIEIEMS